MSTVRLEPILNHSTNEMTPLVDQLLGRSGGTYVRRTFVRPGQMEILDVYHIIPVVAVIIAWVMLKEPITLAGALAFLSSSMDTR